MNEVQRSVVGVGKAIDQSNREVADGLATAGETDEALGSIRAAVANVGQQMDRLSQVVLAMGVSSANLQTVMVDVASIGSENMVSAEKLTEFSGRVNHAMSEVSAITEESSAAAEEVSANAEEVSAQVEEVVISVDVLAAQAKQLLEITAKFQVGDEVKSADAAPVSSAPSADGEDTVVVEAVPSTPPAFALVHVQAAEVSHVNGKHYPHTNGNGNGKVH